MMDSLCFIIIRPTFVRDKDTTVNNLYIVNDIT